MSEQQNLRVKLVEAGVPNSKGIAYPEDQLIKLAQQFPEKLVYKDGALYSLEPIQDTEHRQRWWEIIGYHIERMPQ